MAKAQSERRRHPRVNVGGGTTGTVNAVHDVALLDISLGGALIEHAQVVQPGIAFDLVLTLPGQKLKPRCRAVRSVVFRSEAQAKGEGKLIYQQVVSDYIRSIIEGEQKGGAEQPDAAGPLEQGRLQPERTPGKRSRRS
jgi:hypothetical protein